MTQRVRVWISVAVFALGLTTTGAYAQNAASATSPGAVATETARGQQRLQERNELRLEGPAVVGPKPAETLIPPSGGATFLLKKVEFDRSEFISAGELDALAAPYLGQQIDNARLQQLLKAVNDIYARRRIITALAYLPQQDLKSGVLRIGIVEGRLGALGINGNQRVSAEEVMAAISMAPGAVIDVPQLERDVARFNKTRNAQIQASLQPGATFGLTDVQIKVIEPPADTLQVFKDNQGVKSVGAYQVGVNYQRLGLLNADDKLSFYGVRAHGNLNGSLSYSALINPWGGRINFSASRGQIHIYNGPYAVLDIDGWSHSGTVNISQPVYTDANWALLANAGYSTTASSSKLSHVLISENVTVKKTVGATISFTATDFQVSIAPTYSFANSDLNVVDVKEKFRLIGGTYAAALQLPANFTFSLSGAAQWATKPLLASDQLFQIGGPTTVRGYPTNGVAGYAGYFANFELHHTLSGVPEGLDIYTFYDTGAVYSTFPDKVSLSSVGAGLSWSSPYRTVFDVSVGTPLTNSMPHQRDYFAYFRMTAKLL